ncbi:MAG TPA: hypothetical protein VFD52_05810, partial [Clostridia bacterium]|nr:hypothetical protein [Clostridia bacterium]
KIMKTYYVMDYQNGNKSIMEKSEYEKVQLEEYGKDVTTSYYYDEAIAGVVKSETEPTWDDLEFDEETKEYFLKNTKNEIKAMDWKEFLDLDEVQVDQSPTGYGNALFYNNGTIQVSVDFEGHDDVTLWKNEELAEELKSLVVEKLDVTI